MPDLIVGLSNSANSTRVQAARSPPGSISIDRWQGAERVQFRLIDLAEAGPFGGR